MISQLKYPTYTAYDYKHKYLYVCDCDEILQFEIDFGADDIKAIKKGAVAREVFCGGLAVDKFSNLFYVGTDMLRGGKPESAIKRLNRDLLQTEKYPVELVKKVYEGAVSSAAKNIQDISIESEYLYWTNDSHQNGHGGVHKAFTEPFIKAEPFQTYEIKDVDTASDIATNENYLFFTGQQQLGIGQGDAFPELFI